MDDKLQKCSNCKVSRELINFIGKLGGPVKRCLKCRQKDDKQKKRPDVIEKRKIRQKEKKYYIKYRINKREENEEEYLKHNAELKREWNLNNKDYLAQWSTNNFKSRLGAIKSQANKKNIDWNDNMTDNICENMMKSNCYYCNFISLITLNGIDRMDNSKCYIIENCVSCCKNCNFIKKCLDPITFLKRCQHISIVHLGKGLLNNNYWSNSNSVNYNMYINRAIRKNLEFNLTNEMFDIIKKKECYYCLKINTNLHQNGIDRKKIY